MSTTIRWFRLVPVVLAGAVVTGCGSGDGTDDRRGTASVAPSVSERFSAGPSPAAPSAADATNLRACVDGRCQVAVSDRVELPLDGKFGLATVSIGPLEEENLTVRQTSPGARVSMGVAVGCHVRLTPGRAQSYCQGGTPPSGDDGITITFDGVAADGAAVVSVAPTPS